MSFEPQPEHRPGPIAADQIPLAPAEQRMSIMALLHVLMKRRIIILAATVICFTAVALYTLRMKPVYETVSRVEIDPNTSPNVGLQTLIQDRAEGQGNSSLQTEILILQSDSVIFQTAQSLNLISKLRGDSAKTSKGPVPVGAITPQERRSLIGSIRGGLKVQILGSTQMIEIRYRSGDAQLGALVVNGLVDNYIDVDLRTKFERTKHVSTWLQKQLDDLKQEGVDSQGRLVEYQKQHNIVGSDDSSGSTMANLAQISAQFESAEVDRIMKEARLREFESKDPDMAALMGDNPQLSSLRAQLTGLKTQRAELMAKFGARHPKVQELDAQISKLNVVLEGEYSLARQQIADEYAGALRLQESFRKRLEAQKAEAYRLTEGVAQYEILRHEAELNRDLYDTLEMRLKQASVAAGLSATNITVIDRAEPALYPIAPNKRLNIILGLIGGFLVGIVLAFLAESIDDTLQTSEEAEAESMLPSLATIPHILSATEKNRRKGKEDVPTQHYAQQLVTLRSPKSIASEAYRGLRNSLLLSSIDKPPQVILLTSAFPGEGKTTTAMNIAIVLAQRGEKVLLVDADLRRGTLNAMLNFEDRSIGLSTILSQPSLVRELPVPLAELPTLHALPTGPRPPNPAEMLSSNRMKEQLRQWRSEYDRIILDTAPILAVSDTQTLAPFADSVILVVRAGVTRKRALIRARDLLLRISSSISGVVVNDVDLRLENFYTSRYGMYGYNYGYRYRYGRPYSDNAYGYEDDEKGE